MTLVSQITEFIGLFPRYHVVDNQVYSVVLSGFERFLQQAQDALTLLESEND